VLNQETDTLFSSSDSFLVLSFGVEMDALKRRVVPGPMETPAMQRRRKCWRKRRREKGKKRHGADVPGGKKFTKTRGIIEEGPVSAIPKGE